MAQKSEPGSGTSGTPQAPQTSATPSSDDLASLEQAVQTAVDQAEADRLGVSGQAEPREFEADLSPRPQTSKDRAKRFSRAISDVFFEMSKSLKAKDPATRKMSIVFFLGLLSVAVAAGVGLRRYVHLQDLEKLKAVSDEETSKNLSEFIQKQAEHAKKKFATLSLGRFTPDLQPLRGSKPGRGVLSVADIEIIIECDNKETRYFVEDHLQRARDQVTGALAGLERDDLLTPDGKRRLKRKLMDHLNRWLPQGKVEDLFISHQVLN